jgi:subtilase family serine protease
VALAVLGACATAQPPPPSPVRLPTPAAGIITFYLGLPTSTAALRQAAAAASSPGSSGYRRFTPLADAAARFGASDQQIDEVVRSVGGLGLQVTVDPTRLFARVSGSAEQWRSALGAPLSRKPATSAEPFDAYELPNEVPDALVPKGTTVLLPVALVYDPSREGGRAPRAPRGGGSPGSATPWPANTGTPFQADCGSPVLAQRQVYTPTQVGAAYGLDALQRSAAGRPTITVLDLGGGWSARDGQLAGGCFGYTPPAVAQSQADGVPNPIAHADDETSLDLQTISSVAPGANLRLVQATDGGAALLDAFSRAIADPAGPPDAVSVSYGGCAVAEETAAPDYLATGDDVLAMAAVAGVSTFVAAGDTGSTTCPKGVQGTSLSFPAVSPYVTAVGGTRIALGAGNARTGETVWNDTPYGQAAAGGGGVSKGVAEPDYQTGVQTAGRRAIPDVSAQAAIVPGWPVVIDGVLQPVGGTSGATPLVAAATALVSGSERQAGRPPVGFANPWLYAAAPRAAFFDVVEGNNDLAGVGCCTAGPGYDTASGLGVPNWAALPATLPPPGG